MKIKCEYCEYDTSEKCKKCEMNPDGSNFGYFVWNKDLKEMIKVSVETYIRLKGESK